MKLSLPLPSLSLWCIATVANIQFGFSSKCSEWNYIHGNIWKYDTYCSGRTLVCKNITLDLITYYYSDNFYRPGDVCDTVNVEDSYNPFITSASFNQQVKHLIFELNLKNNCVQSIANDTFINFSKLRVINFDHNELGNLDFIDDISELRQLSVTNNNMTQLYASNFEKLKELEGLNLTFNKLTSIGNESFNLYSLQTIVLSNNNSKQIEGNIFSNLHKLKFLNLSSNKLEFIEIHAFKGLNKLISLDLSANKLKSLQEETFFDLSSLQNLKLNYNCLENILANIFRDLKNLKSLDLSSNKISTLATDSFIGLDNLQRLLLSNNTIKEVPLGFFKKNLKNVEGLDLSSNKISTLATDSFIGLINLQQLLLSNNMIKEVPLGFFKKNFKKLESLDLSSNKISTLATDSFIGLDNLQQLSLSNNTIKEVPLGCLRNFPNLKTLNLGVNYLTQFKTGSFSNLRELIHLNLSHNRFSVVNEAVLYPLNELELLDLDNNSLSFINYTSLLSHLPNLRFISINDNKWSCKFLTNMLKAFGEKGKDYLFHATSQYTEENVHGILCSEFETSFEINSSYFDNSVLKNEIHTVFHNMNNDAITNLSNIVNSTKELTKALIQLLQYYNRSKTINIALEGEGNTIIALEQLYQLVNNTSKTFTGEVSNFNFTDFLIVILLCIICVLLTLTLYMKYFRKVLKNKRRNETSSIIELF